MSEPLLVQILGWLMTLGAAIGYIRARLNDLSERVKTLETKVDRVEEICLKCLGRKEIEK